MLKRMVLMLIAAIPAIVFVLLAPLLWPALVQPEPQIVEVEVEVPAPVPEWLVLATDQPIRTVGQGFVIEGCITYTTPAGGSQETCRQITIGGGGDSTTFEAVEACWGRAEIGAPLPGCWR